jgi:hypothetical protein
MLPSTLTADSRFLILSNCAFFFVFFVPLFLTIIDLGHLSLNITVKQNTFNTERHTVFRKSFYFCLFWLLINDDGQRSRTFAPGHLVAWNYIITQSTITLFRVFTTYFILILIQKLTPAWKRTNLSSDQTSIVQSSGRVKLDSVKFRL